jgi:hypothetical protein
MTKEQQHEKETYDIFTRYEGVPVQMYKYYSVSCVSSPTNDPEKGPGRCVTTYTWKNKEMTKESLFIEENSPLEEQFLENNIRALEVDFLPSDNDMVEILLLTYSEPYRDSQEKGRV